MIKVIPVSGKRELRKFVRFPYSFYQGQPHWIPPLRTQEMARLNPESYPFYDHAELQLFLALDNGVVKGRIAGIDDSRYNEFHGANRASFGFFEAANQEVARELFEAVEVWAGARGRSRLAGPLSPSLDDTCGLLVEGFDRDPGIMMPYNPPEYVSYFEQADFRRSMDLLSWDVDLRSQRVQRLAEWAESHLSAPNELTIRAADRKRFLDELELIRCVYSSAWGDNWGFVPPTERELEYLGRQLLQVMDPDLALIAEANGRPVAIAVGIYDLNQILRGTNGWMSPRFLMRFIRRRNLIDRGRLYLFGVLPEFRGPEWRVLPLLARELHRGARRLGCHQVEMGWVLKNNEPVNKALAWVGGEHTKTYRIYEKNLDTDRST